MYDRFYWIGVRKKEVIDGGGNDEFFSRIKIFIIVGDKWIK